MSDMSDTWYALDDDMAVTQGSSTPEAAAEEYYGDLLWDSRHLTAPESVTVARAITKTHAEYAAHLGYVVAESISSAMCDDGGEWAEDACQVLDRAGDSLDDLLAPVIEAWLKEQVPSINWWQEAGRRVMPRPTETPERHSTSPRASVPGAGEDHMTEKLDPTETLARFLLTWKYGQEFGGRSLLLHVDNSGLMNPTANPRAIDAVTTARKVVDQVNASLAAQLQQEREARERLEGVLAGLVKAHDEGIEEYLDYRGFSNELLDAYKSARAALQPSAEAQATGGQG